MKIKGIGIALLTLFFLACNKTEGPGGTAVIQGVVQVADHNNGDYEKTEVFFTPGLEVEHGDYWILNTPVGYPQFYIYYVHPDWVSSADPALAGRTGVAVPFQYTDSNLEMATSTENALNDIASEYVDVTRIGDILLITNKMTGHTADADNVTTPFELNIDEQGDDSHLGDFQPAVDEKVYIKYGEKTIYGDVVRTGGEGDFEFANLTTGNYTVYAVSKDTSALDATVIVEKEVEVLEKKSVVEVPEIFILR